MSFFGKFKNLHGGSLAPPKTAENKTRWPQDKLDDEEGDMYEAPPCERPVVKVQMEWRKAEENIYLGRTSRPAVPQRQTAPPPRQRKASTPQQHAEEFNHYLNTKKPPEIDRNEKPVRTQLMPPPPGCSGPAPFPASSPEEDAYLDPNEEQDESEDLYLEPTAAGPPAACGPMRMPLSPKTPHGPSPMPIIKPPVPRAKSNSVLSFLTEVKKASSEEVRHATFPSKVNTPTPAVKPRPSTSLQDAKLSPSNPLADTKPVAISTKQCGNEDKEWFAGDCNRKSAEDVLLKVNKDGAFLIRHSSAQGTRQPYTLVVLYQKKVYNIPIRFLEEARGYALGKEGKKNEEIFSTLDGIISHHRNNQLFLIDSKSQAKHTAYLTHPARP